MLPETAPLLYRELAKIATHSGWTSRDKVLALASLLERIFLEATKQEQLVFSTLFARISYAGHLYQLQPDTLRLIHTFRRLSARVRAGLDAGQDRVVRLGVKALAEIILVLCRAAIPPEVLEHLPASGEWTFTPPDIWDYKTRARVVAVRDEPERQCLLAYDDEEPGQPVWVRYNLPERNDNFNPTIRLLRTVFGFPVTLNLLEIDIDRNGEYRPRVFVVEPDYLMDVTAVAECFKENSAQPLAYLVKKFLPYDVTPAILVGNIANFFLDRLLTEPDISFQDVFRETFLQYPFVYAPMSDAAVREVSAKAQKHYLNLKSMARQGLAQQNIAPEHCVLEPTFYSEQYGLQGRLDLFYRDNARAAIVELKSGTPFKPNNYGIQRSHFTQTLLYDLLVRSVFGVQTDPAKYILYSGAETQPLRFAPTVAPEQWEALQVRNQLVAIERLIAGIRPGEVDIPLFLRLRAGTADARDFLARDFGLFETVYSRLSPLEKKYFNAFAGFIAREQWLAKVGDDASDTANGNAALWRSSFADKQEAFAILSHLEIVENRADQPDPSITFHKTERTNPLANFRVGDIAVLYPALDETDSVLSHQVIKCTITALNAQAVVVQLRYRQFNLKPFAIESLWNLEPDMLDTGFATMYRGLFEWAGASAEIRRRVLEVSPSSVPSSTGEGDDGSGIGNELGGEDADGKFIARLSALGSPSPVPSPTGEGDDGSGIGNEFDAEDADGKFTARLSTSESRSTVSPSPLGEGTGEGWTTQATPPKTASYGQPQETTDLARWRYLKSMVRGLRKFQTSAEFVLWQALRNQKFQHLKFRRQHAIDDYIVDFVCLELRLVIEVDGNIHDYLPEYDQIRTEYLEILGFSVVRFSNNEVLKNLEHVLGRLAQVVDIRQRALAAPGIPPSPRREGDDGSGIGNEFDAEDADGKFIARLSTSESRSTVSPSPLGEGTGEGASGQGLTPAQIAATPHFFLLWGPPGTGKTSVMLRDLAAWVLHESADNLLLLAYTNRAVDEICEALDSLGGDIREQYIRLGSRFSTAQRFRGQLLSTLIASVRTRAELRAVLEPRRIFVSTVASFAQNDKLLEIKKFHRLIVDEASQILEPQLVGLLTRFEHFILIGDHRQLPAVTAQPSAQTLVSDPELNTIGLTDLRDSYFERLYRQCIRLGLRQHYGQLDRQGRMHAEIMAFPNEYFYGGMLQTLASAVDPSTHRQHAPIPQAGADVLRPPVLQAFELLPRVLFIPVVSHNALPYQKTALEEANLVAELAVFFKQYYASQGKPWHPEQRLGVITPWRAQIAQLRQSLTDAGLDPDEITIDTVERYQGGARDVIIISCCVHAHGQLNNLVNLSTEGVDRKLNVALTRAREHVIMLGNPEVLREDERYRAFMEAYGIRYDRFKP